MNTQTAAEIRSYRAEFTYRTIGNIAILRQVGIRPYFYIMEVIWRIHASIIRYRTIRFLGFGQRITASLPIRYNRRIEDIAKKFLDIIFEFHDLRLIQGPS